MLTACVVHEDDTSSRRSAAGMQKITQGHGILGKYSFDMIRWAVFNLMVKEGRCGHLKSRMDEKPKGIFSDCDEPAVG